MLVDSAVKGSGDAPGCGIGCCNLADTNPTCSQWLLLKFTGLTKQTIAKLRYFVLIGDKSSLPKSIFRSQHGRTMK